MHHNAYEISAEENKLINEYVNANADVIDPNNMPKHAWYTGRTMDLLQAYGMGFINTELGSDAGHAQGEFANNFLKHMADPTFQWSNNYGSSFGISEIGNTNNNYTSKYADPQKEAEYQHFLKEIPQDVRDENRYDLRAYYAKMTGLN